MSPEIETVRSAVATLHDLLLKPEEGLFTWNQLARHAATKVQKALCSLGVAPHTVEQEPIAMLLFCPGCDAQHIDAPEPESNWTNPPHKSHLCHMCGVIWRPADVPTTGVAYLKPLAHMTPGSAQKKRYRNQR